MSSFDFEKPRIIYACNKCCTKLSKEGEKCFRCHSGVGVQQIRFRIISLKLNLLMFIIIFFITNVMARFRLALKRNVISMAEIVI